MHVSAYADSIIIVVLSLCHKPVIWRYYLLVEYVALRTLIFSFIMLFIVTETKAKSSYITKYALFFVKKKLLQLRNRIKIEIIFLDQYMRNNQL